MIEKTIYDLIKDTGIKAENLTKKNDNNYSCNSLEQISYFISQKKYEKLLVISPKFIKCIKELSEEIQLDIVR